jgi:hypothetical protein
MYKFNCHSWCTSSVADASEKLSVQPLNMTPTRCQASSLVTVDGSCGYMAGGGVMRMGRTWRDTGREGRSCNFPGAFSG